MRPDAHKAKADDAKLSGGALARFAAGLDWAGIIAIGGKGPGWWRLAIADAEDHGLLEWDRKAKRWRLTDEGRKHTRGIS